MDNNLKRIDKSLRSLSKRNKSIKYTPELLFSYLMVGTVAFSSGVMGEAPILLGEKNSNINIAKDIRMSMEQKKIQERKELKDSSFVFLAQKDSDVKSPWNSWQVGLNPSSNSWNSIYNIGEAGKEYPLEGMLTGSGDIFDRYSALMNSNYTTLSRNKNLFSANPDRKIGYSYGLAQDRIIMDPLIPASITDEKVREELEEEAYREAMINLRKADELIFKKLVSTVLMERHTTLSNNMNLIAMSSDQKTDFSIGLAKNEIIKDKESENIENTITKTSLENLEKEIKIIGGDIKDIKESFKLTRKENDKLIKNSNLELIQLMEQGEQVIKSPWTSWQFGINTFSTGGSGSYKGKGDKSEKYPFNGIYSRGNWSETTALLGRGNVSRGSISSSNRGNLNYGLVGLLRVQEPEVEIQIMANVRPKEIKKEEIVINPSIDMPKNIIRPSIALSVNEPLKAPTLVFPMVSPVSILVENPVVPNEPALATAPAMNINLETPDVSLAVKAPKLEMNITSPAPTVGALTIIPPTVNPVQVIKVQAPSAIVPPIITLSNVNPVDFILSPHDMSASSRNLFGRNDTGVTYNKTDSVYEIVKSPIVKNSPADYLATWGYVMNQDQKITSTVNVRARNTRAYMVDEGIDDDYKGGYQFKPFTHKGIINLYNNENVGIDVQGTHSSYGGGGVNLTYASGSYSGQNYSSKDYNNMEEIVNVKIINEGYINGVGKSDGTVINQVAFGFNNYDASANNTRNEMINEGSGKLILGAPKSVGIQLRPENPAGDGNSNNKRGLNMMAGINRGSIDLNSYGSFGILTVKNKSASASSLYNNIYGLANTTTGGQIASYSSDTYMSKIENTGQININGDESIGVGLLHNIQGVYVNGEINIGTAPVNQDINQNSGTDVTKVEQAVGVYSEVETRPVWSGSVDDFSRLNNGGISGTESIEVKGEIIIGENSENSTALRVKDRGAITLKSGGNIILDTNSSKNYGIVVEGNTFNRIVERTRPGGTGTVNERTESRTGRIDIENGGIVNVKGQDSIGFVLLQGAGSNAGEINVNADNSLGFYGEKGVFENSGTIETTGQKSHGIVLQNTGSVSSTSAVQTMTFDNKNGEIIVNTEGAVGIYAQSGSIFNHEGNNAKITAGAGAIGIYTKDAGTTGTVSSEIEVKGSIANNTGIGVYSDGSSITTFNTGATLTLGEGTVGIYSEKASDFETTFGINDLTANIGDNGVFAYFGSTGNSSDDTVNITNSTLGNLTVSKMGENSALFYGDKGTIINLNDNIDIITSGKFSNISDKGQFAVSSGGDVNIDAGKTLTSNLKTTISGLKNGTVAATVTNKGNLELKNKDGAVGIYLNGSKGINDAGANLTTAADGSIGIFGVEDSILENSGSIVINGIASVGMLADKSTATNKTAGSITTNSTGSAGIYGINDSTVSNEGAVNINETGSAGIYVNSSRATNEVAGTITIEKGESAGIYAIATKAETIVNKGKIEVGTSTSSVSERQGIGIYADLTGGTGVLNVQNTGDISLELEDSVGIFTKNRTSLNTDVIADNSGNIIGSKSGAVGIFTENATATNETGGIISLQNVSSVGIYGKSGSSITNKGAINLTSASTVSKSVGILTDTGEVKNIGSIVMDGGASAGMLGKGGAILTNASSGTIVANGISSAGVYVENSIPLNEGTINISGEKSAGIFAKISDFHNYDIINNGDINLIGTTGKESAGMYAEIVSGATGTTVLNNKKNINISQESSAAMYVNNLTNNRNLGTAINSNPDGIINLNVKNTVGILADNALGINNSIINVRDEGSAGMYGGKGGLITNAKDINISHEKSAGMYTLDADAENSSIGTIRLDSTSISDGSAAMYAVLSPNAASAHTSINSGKILLNTGVKNVGMAGVVENGAIQNLSIKNEKEIKIEAGSPLSVGMSGLNTEEISQLNIHNTSTGIIVSDSSESIGISAEKSTIINDGTVTMNGDDSAGIYGKSDSEITNNSNININGDKSAGIFLENSDAINTGNGSITVFNEESAGIYGKISTGSHTITNEGIITLDNGNSKTRSVGVYGSLIGGKLNIDNNNLIQVDMKESVGIYADSNSLADMTVINAQNGNINVNNEKSVGIFSNNSTVSNEGNINITTLGVSGTGIFGKDRAKVKNTATGIITAEGKKSSGIYVSGTLTEGTNFGKINLNAENTNGMVSTTNAKAVNESEIIGNSKNVIGMYGNDAAEIVNALHGKIELKDENSTGMFSKDGTLSKNEGTINLKKNSSVGMFGLSTGFGKVIGVTNAGTINVDSDKSTGMFTKNDGNLSDSTVNNIGTINLNGRSTVGIYTPKSDIRSVGTINLSGNAESSVAVYLSEGGKADTTTGIIDLGNASQSRVAYYVKGTNASDTGKLYGGNIGTVKGYGVGVYLDGGILDGNTSKLDYTANWSGDGIIGLLMKGATADISSYTAEIKVGNSILGYADKYAIGIYAEGQGTLSVPKNITNNITTGSNGVGLFAESGSHINYTGNMTVGNGATAGTGIYVGNGNPAGTGPSKVVIDNGAYITLNGINGVGAIVTENSTTDFNLGSTIEFHGDGVGIYGQKGAIIHDNGGRLVTNGHSVERTRVTEGSAVATSDIVLETGNIMYHVINGEAILNTGVSVIAKPASKNIIGLMADGIKNESLAHWVGTLGYEAENRGIIDLSNAETSTAMYLDSSEGINTGKINMGNKSTGIYGIYRNTTPIYSGASVGTVNVGTIATDAASSISVGNESSAIYSVGFNKIDNKGFIEGGDKSVGIYVKNAIVDGYKTINVENKGNITLGKGGAGIYVSPSIETVSNSMVLNTGNITVGDSITDSAGNVVNTSVGIFIENDTVLNTSGDVTVGNKGFAFYGNNNSIINVNGGNYNFTNNGSLGYLGNNSVLNYNNAGILTTSSEPMLYIIDSRAEMNGNDIVVSGNGTGIYMSGTSYFGGWNNIILNNSSTGIYVNNSNSTLNGSKIIGTIDKAKGVVALNSDITNNANMDFTGNDSIGIFSRNNSPAGKNIVNNGDISVKGERSIGTYLEGSGNQVFKNTGKINVDKNLAPSRNDSTVGVYAVNGGKIDIENDGQIDVGEGSFGIYSFNESGNVKTTASSVINVSDKGVGIYKKGGSSDLAGIINVAAHTGTEVNSEPVGVYGAGGVNITDYTRAFNVGDRSYGVILANPGSHQNIYSNSTSSTISLGNESTFIYADGEAQVTNNGTITGGTNKSIIALYGKNGGKIVNNGMIDLSQGVGNQGILVSGSNSVGQNSSTGVIKIGKTDKSDPNNIIYGIGMAAIDGGILVNKGDVYVLGNSSIGMYGDGKGTILRNEKNIYLDASSATSSDKINTMMGVFVNNGATFVNTGDIRTLHSYSQNSNVQGIVGVAVLNGSTLENYGTIDIDARDSYGVLIKGTVNNKSVIKNYGNIRIRGLNSYGVRYDANTQGVTANTLPVGAQAVPSNVLTQINAGGGNISSSGGGEDYYAPKDPSKTVGGVGIISMPDGTLAIERNGVILKNEEITVLDIPVQTTNFGFSNFGVYVDTLGRTKPIDVDGATSLGINSDLIIGAEFSALTNSKNVVIGNQILAPFLSQINSGIFNFTPYSGSLSWMATPEVDPVTQQINRIVMTKIPYTAFVPSGSNEFNFTDGLEQRYGVEGLDSMEKLLFEKLNSIGNNEEALMAQAFDEMMGHQYSNIGQRIYATGNMLDKEFSHLRKEWETKSKDSNKIKIFGMKDKYSTDTAGVIDYTSDSYGVAYLHENETVRLGDTTGWYVGVIQNSFKFKDIGGSKENSLLVKGGVFKSIPFDYNNSLNWTISAEGFVAKNNMKRKFLVVDSVFGAEADYYAYGGAVKNEIGKEFRLGENTSMRVFGSLKLEYGKVGNIKEDTGEIRLEVKENDYYSIKPEIGLEFKFRKPVAKKSIFTATLGAGYESELGKVGDIGNRGRVRYTNADWFNIPGEKDSVTGNFKVDLNIGLENNRIGVTLNGGYDTKGENFRGGIGIRAIY